MKEKMQFISKKVNAFQNTSWVFLLYLGPITLFIIYNYLSYWLNINFYINTPWWGKLYNNSNNGWIGWTEITISSLGSLLTIIGVIFTLRFNRKYIIPVILGESLVIIDSILIGAIFTSLSYLIMVSVAIYSYLTNWKKGDEKTNFVNSMTWIIICFFLILYIIFGLTISWTLIYKIDSENWFINGIVDVICSGVVVCSWFLCLKKSKWGFIGFFITDIIYLIWFALSIKLIVVSGSYVVYAIMDSLSFIGWYEQ